MPTCGSSSVKAAKAKATTVKQAPAKRSKGVTSHPVHKAVPRKCQWSKSLSLNIEGSDNDSKEPTHVVKPQKKKCGGTDADAEDGEVVDRSDVDEGGGRRRERGRAGGCI